MAIDYGQQYWARKHGAATPAAEAGVTSLPKAQAPSGYSLSPTPTAGVGAFGGVPGQVGLPNIAAQMEEQVPGIKSINQEIAGNIMSDIRGQLDPDTIAQIQDAAASFGAGAGMPGSGLALNRGLRDIGLRAEDVRSRGQQAYSSFVPTVANTQVISPEAQIQTAVQNALNAAAPDPTAAASYSQSLFNSYMRQANPMVVTETSSPRSAFSLQSETRRTEYDPLTGQVRRRQF